MKTPAPDDIFVQRHYGGSWRAANLPADLIEQARRTLEMAVELAGLPGLEPRYARVGGLDVVGRLTLMELEVNEPGLLLEADPAAAMRFADAIASATRWT